MPQVVEEVRCKPLVALERVEVEGLPCSGIESPRHVVQTRLAVAPVECGGDAERDAARLLVVGDALPVVLVEVPEDVAHLRQPVVGALSGEEVRHGPVVGKSGGHDLARRGNDVVEAAAQVVERLDVGHEAGVEDQVVEAVGECFDHRREVGDVDLVSRVAERTGRLGIGQRLPEVVADGCASGLCAELHARGVERSGDRRHPRLAVAADDEAVLLGRGVFGYVGKHLRERLRRRSRERGILLEGLDDAAARGEVVAHLLQRGRLLPLGLVADEDAAVARHLCRDGPADAVDVVVVEREQRPPGHVEQHRARGRGGALAYLERARGCGALAGGRAEGDAAQCAARPLRVFLRCGQRDDGLAPAARDGRDVEAAARDGQFPRPVGRDGDGGLAAASAAQHDLRRRELEPRCRGLLLAAGGCQQHRAEQHRMSESSEHGRSVFHHYL